MDTIINKIFYSYSDAVEGESFGEISLEFPQGSFSVIVGRSGCGKSTLLRLIAGLLKQKSGTVERPESVGMVFQGGALLPWLSAIENIQLILGKGHKRKALESLSVMNMLPYKDKLPRSLSGGERQRVGIARALAVEPELLILDEPFSALDLETTQKLHAELIHIWQQTKMTIIMVSHSIEEAVLLSDQVIVMEAGKIKTVIPNNTPRPRIMNDSLESLVHRVGRLV